ncbi:MAG TPA: hypothetical protein VMM35_09510 [Longimicrobiales bacterium]|nr:hypothetical protein [Longimicrobiales bacterium]
MRTACLAGAVALLGSTVAAACGAQQGTERMVVSSDPELAELAADLLPGLAERSGLALLEPVRLERRSRSHLIRYLEQKLDEELPAEEARAMVDAYALFGLVPPDLDLRALLLGLYTEQVAGFYDPDSTALFVMDDQPEEALQGLLVHELVHAIQDQGADLAALTDPALGNDRVIAAQAAIEGHATLVMLEYMTEQMAGVAVDLAEIPNFSAQMRPALEAMRGQFPALAGAPRVVQESLLFPYLEGTGFVQDLWSREGRVAPFGARLPQSTEEVLEAGAAEPPVDLRISVEGGRVVDEDVLGRLELGVLLDDHLGEGSAALADGWDGDRYALVERADGTRGLIWYAVWEDTAARDLFASGMERALGSLGGPAALERVLAAGRPGTLGRVGALGGVSSSVGLAGAP